MQRQRLLTHTQRVEHELYAAAGYAKGSLTDKIVIIIDDGVATGMTAVAAVDTARRRGARRVIMAGARYELESYHALRAHCDNVVTFEYTRTFQFGFWPALPRFCSNHRCGSDSGSQREGAELCQ